MASILYPIASSVAKLRQFYSGTLISDPMAEVLSAQE